MSRTVELLSADRGAAAARGEAIGGGNSSTSSVCQFESSRSPASLLRDGGAVAGRCRRRLWLLTSTVVLTSTVAALLVVWTSATTPPTPAPTPAPTPVPTPVPTHVPAPVPTPDPPVHGDTVLASEVNAGEKVLHVESEVEFNKCAKVQIGRGYLSEIGVVNTTLPQEIHLESGVKHWHSRGSPVRCLAFGGDGPVPTHVPTPVPTFAPPVHGDTVLASEVNAGEKVLHVESEVEFNKCAKAQIGRGYLSEIGVVNSALPREIHLESGVKHWHSRGSPVRCLAFGGDGPVPTHVPTLRGLRR